MSNEWKLFVSMVEARNDAWMYDKKLFAAARGEGALVQISPRGLLVAFQDRLDGSYARPTYLARAGEDEKEAESTKQKEKEDENKKEAA